MAEKPFYEVSDYTIAASSDVASENYARVRGFVPNIANEDSYGSVYEWCLTVDWKTKTLFVLQQNWCAATVTTARTESLFPLKTKEYAPFIGFHIYETVKKKSFLS